MSATGLRILLCLFVLAATGAGTVGGAEREQVTADEPDVVEVVRFDRTPDTPGQVEVTMEYRLSDDVESMVLNLGRTYRMVTVVDQTGFRPPDSDADSTWEASTYEWDGTTSTPSVDIRIGNLTSANLGGLNYVDTGSWAVVPVGPETHGVYYRNETGLHDTFAEPGTMARSYQFADRGVALSRAAYLGPYERWNFTTDAATFSVVVPEAAQPIDRAAIESSLRASDKRMRSTERSIPISVLVTANPIRPGGHAIRAPTDVQESYFTVHRSASPYSTWLHEYTHIRQDVRVGPQMTWYIEGSASYMEQYLALETGQITYNEYLYHYERYGSPDQSLASIRGFDMASYRLGDLFLAALDAKLRNETGGNATFMTLFQRLNEYPGDLYYEDFVAVTTEVAGTPMDEWLAANMQRAVRPEIPRDADLFVSAGDDSDGDGPADGPYLAGGTDRPTRDSGSDGVEARDESRDPLVIDSGLNTLGKIAVGTVGAVSALIALLLGRRLRR